MKGKKESQLAELRQQVKGLKPMVETLSACLKAREEHEAAPAIVLRVTQKDGTKEDWSVADELLMKLHAQKSRELHDVEFWMDRLGGFEGELTFISGGYDGQPSEEVKQRFADAAARIKEGGNTPLNPLLVTSETAPAAQAYYSNLGTIRDCGAIYMLRGYETSNRACAEYYFAKALGLQVRYESKEEVEGEV